MSTQELIKLQDTNISYMKAELDVAITTAQAFKRDTDVFLSDAIKTATINQEIAASCLYAIPRKIKNQKTGQYEQGFIKGKSIRLAEIIISTYCNLNVGTRIVRWDAKTVTVEGAAWDLEKRTKVVQEVIENINGTHSDAMKLAAASASSKALRNAVFKIVPGALCDEIYKKAEEFAVGTQKTLPETRRKVFERINKLGISNQQIFDFYGKTAIEDFTQEMVAEIIGVGTAIKEGGVSINNAFNKDYDSEKTDTKADEVNSLIGG